MAGEMGRGPALQGRGGGDCPSQILPIGDASVSLRADPYGSCQKLLYRGGCNSQTKVDEGMECVAPHGMGCVWPAC